MSKNIKVVNLDESLLWIFIYSISMNHSMKVESSETLFKQLSQGHNLHEAICFTYLDIKEERRYDNLMISWKTLCLKPHPHSNELTVVHNSHQNPSQKQTKVTNPLYMSPEFSKPTQDWPNSVNGRIVATSIANNSIIYGYGTIIGPNLVLTAASTIYDRKTQQKYNSFKFYPGLDDISKDSDGVDVFEVYCSQSYIENGTRNYGLMVLDQPIGLKTGYFGMRFEHAGRRLEEENVKVQNFSIHDTYKKHKILGLPAKIKDVDDIKLESVSFYESADLENIKDGCPIIFNEYDDYYIIGMFQELNERI